MLSRKWKPVMGYEGLYEVSNLGEIRSLAREISCKDGKIKKMKEKYFSLKPHLTSGYVLVTLTKDKVRKTRLVHVLVAEAFIPNPKNKPQVNHLFTTTNLNFVSNLEWATSAEDAKHRVAVGASTKGTKNPSNKLTEADVYTIRWHLSEGLSRREVSEKVGISSGAVSGIKYGSNWGWLN